MHPHTANLRSSAPKNSGVLVALMFRGDTDTQHWSQAAFRGCRESRILPLRLTSEWRFPAWCHRSTRYYARRQRGGLSLHPNHKRRSACAGWRCGPGCNRAGRSWHSGESSPLVQRESKGAVSLSIFCTCDRRIIRLSKPVRVCATLMSKSHSFPSRGMQHTTSPMNRTSLYSTPTAVDTATRSLVVSVICLLANAWKVLPTFRRSPLPSPETISILAYLPESGVNQLRRHVMTIFSHRSFPSRQLLHEKAGEHVQSGDFTFPREVSCRISYHPRLPIHSAEKCRFVFTQEKHER